MLRSCRACANSSDNLLRHDRRSVEFRAERRQGVSDRIGNYDRRGYGATFAQPLDAERVERRWRTLVHKRDVRYVARSRHHVVYQRPREELAFGIIGEALEEGTAYALHGPADDLALDQHRVNHDAAVMRHRVALDLHSA